MTKVQSTEDVEFLTTKELVESKWFPVRSVATIYQLIKAGKLRAVNIGTQQYKRFRVEKRSALEFVESQLKGTNKKK